MACGRGPAGAASQVSPWHDQDCLLQYPPGGVRPLPLQVEVSGTCTHPHMHTPTHVHTHTCTHPHMYTPTHAHTHACTHMTLTYALPHAYPHMHTQEQTHAYTCTHTCKTRVHTTHLNTRAHKMPLIHVLYMHMGMHCTNTHGYTQTHSSTHSNMPTHFCKFPNNQQTANSIITSLIPLPHTHTRHPIHPTTPRRAKSLFKLVYQNVIASGKSKEGAQTLDDASDASTSNVLGRCYHRRSRFRQPVGDYRLEGRVMGIYFTLKCPTLEDDNYALPVNISGIGGGDGLHSNSSQQ